LTVLTSDTQTSRYVTIEASVYEELVEAARTWKVRAECAEARAERAEARVRELESEVSRLIARVNQLEHELYGTKSEKSKEEPHSDSSSSEHGESQPKKGKPKKQSGRTVVITIIFPLRL